MKKLKSRFKKALFAFFKEEILESIGSIQHVEHICKEVKMTEIRTEILLDETESERYGTPVSVIYQRCLEQARKDLFEESMKYIQVDKKSIIDPRIRGRRTIRVSLFVGTEN